MKNINKNEKDLDEKIKQKMGRVSKEKKSYEELLAFYEQKKESYMKTSFFRKRIYITVGFLLIVILVFPFIPETENTLGPAGYIMSIAFFAVIVLVDQILLGLYLFKTRNKIT